MIGPFGRQGPAATLRQHCPQMTQRRCRKSSDFQGCKVCTPTFSRLIAPHPQSLCGSFSGGRHGGTLPYLKQRPLQNIGSEAECDFATLPHSRKRTTAKSSAEATKAIKCKAPLCFSVRMTWVDLVGLLSNESMSRGSLRQPKPINRIKRSFNNRYCELTTLCYGCEDS